MHLVAVVGGRRRSVVTDRDGQKVVHQVRVCNLIVAADEASRLEVVRRTRAGAEEEPLEAHPGAVAPFHRRCHRDGLLRRVLDVDLEVILEVLADTRKVVHDVDVECIELATVADPRELQELRRVDRAAAEDHLAGLDPTRPGSRRDLDPDRARPSNSTRLTKVLQRTSRFGRCHDRVEVRPCGAEPSAAMDVAIEGREALLLVPVDVVGEGVARLLNGLEECLEEGARSGATLEHERAVATPELVSARKARLHPLEVGEAVGVVPRPHPRIGCPALVVEGVPALEDHAVDTR